MWKLFSKYKRNEEQAVEPECPLICPDGQFSTSDEQKLAECARHMHMVHQTPDNPVFDLEFKQEVDKTIREMDTSKSETKSVEPIQVKGFKELLSGTKSRSSPGEDGITYNILKSCKDKTIEKICDNLNRCLKDNVFPKQWKSAKVRMLPKPGKDHSKAVSYRPI